MGKIQNTRKSLPCRIAVATAAGLLAVVAGLGMAPAGAADDVSSEAEVEADVNPMKGGFLVMDISDPVKAEVEVKAKDPGNPDDVSLIVSGPGGTGSL